MTRRLRHKLMFWSAATVALSALFSAFAAFGWLDGLHLSLSNYLYWNPTPSPRSDIILVVIDDASLARRTASEEGTLRFAKADYAKAINTLAYAGAEAIGVDVILSEPSAAADVATLARSLTLHPEVVLAARPAYGGIPALSPLPELSEAAGDRVGSVLFVTDQDNVLRRQLAQGEDRTPAFSVAVLNAYLGQGREENGWDGDTYVVSREAVRVVGTRVDALRMPTDDEKRYLIRYFGPPGSFRTVSFADVLDGNLVDRAGDPVDFAKSIVLIGEMGTAIHDEQPTPVSYGRPMSGVEIHANAIQTILSGRSLVEQSRSQAALFAAAIAALALAAFLILSIPLSFALFLFVLVAYTVVTWISFEAGLILNMTYPYLALTLAFGLAYVFRYLTEARIAARTQQAFGLYVSPHVVNEIIEHPELIVRGGRKETLTVLFSDVAGFTTLAEKMDPSDLVEQLNEYLDEMSSVVLEHDGTIDKYIGDAIMAFWNAPLPQPDHATRACLTAIAYQERLKIFNEKRASRGKVSFSARVGINTGEMVVGNVGASNRFDYTVIGDAVNLGARLEGANKSYGTLILISETTYLAAKDAVEVREVDLLAVKGKSQPVRVYELLGRKGMLDEKTSKVKAFFDEALAAYRRRGWDEAETLLKKTLQISPDDGPSLAYLERVAKLRKDPPPEPWDGVYEMKTK